MFSQTNIFSTLFIIPILNVLIALYKGLLYLKVPGTLGFSLILLTCLIRLILSPLTVAQLKSTKALGKLKPELDRLSKLHKNDKQLLYQEQMKLYKKAGINPAAGCLPLIIQMPILLALYNLFFQLLTKGNITQVVSEINKVVYTPLLKINSLDLNFFGLNLAHRPNQWQAYGWWLLLIPLVTGLLQYVQTKMMVPQTSPAPLTKEISKTEDGKKDEEDMSTAMQKQMSIMMPLMIGFFAYSFPLGLSLYWNTFTIFAIIQQYQINKEP